MSICILKNAVTAVLKKKMQWTESCLKNFFISHVTKYTCHIIELSFFKIMTSLLIFVRNDLLEHFPAASFWSGGCRKKRFSWKKACMKLPKTQSKSKNGLTVTHWLCATLGCLLCCWHVFKGKKDPPPCPNQGCCDRVEGDMNFASGLMLWPSWNSSNRNVKPYV